MIHRAKILATMAFIFLGVSSELSAGGIHIRYGPDAPEKLAAANEVYYQGVLNLYHNHPHAFEHDHPFYTKMFNDPTMMNKLVDRWEAHEQRFEYWHLCLWKVLDGYLMSQERLTPPIDILPPPAGTSAVGALVGGGTGNGGIGAQSVPEPSTGVLGISGLLVGLAWLAWRRASVGFRA